MANFSPILSMGIVPTDTSAPAAPGIGDPLHEAGNNIVGSVIWPSTDAGPTPELTGLTEGYITWINGTEPGVDPTVGLSWEQVLQLPQAVSNMTTYPLTPASAGTEQAYSFPKTVGVPMYVIAAAKD